MDRIASRILVLAPPAWTLYPFLCAFMCYSVVNGAWEAGLENAVIRTARVKAEVTSIVEHVKTPEAQIKALGEIEI